MKRWRSIATLLAILIFGSAVYLSVHLLADNFLDRGKTAPTELSCHGKYQHYSVFIMDDLVDPVYIHAKRCDTLTIANSDAKLREIGFGRHDHHQAYDGVTERNLEKNQNLTITLRTIGTYRYHDHFQEEVRGVLIVTN